MIFTRRFGALAARPNFHETERTLEQELELMAENIGQETPREHQGAH